MKKQFLISLFSVLLLSSCGTYYYAPTVQNVLTFKKKGDMILSSGISSTSSYSNIGYSITNNIGVISTLETYEKETDKKYRNNNFIIDNEIVFYKEIEKHLFVAINLGYGYGKLNRNEPAYQLSIHRYFLQPSIGYSNDYFDVALSARFANANYNLKKSSSFDMNNFPSLKEIEENTFGFTETAFTIGAGYKWIKLRYQYNRANTNSSKDISYIDSEMHITLNMTLNIDNCLQKIKDRNAKTKNQSNF